MPALAPDPLDQLETLSRQTASFTADKSFELLLVLDHGLEILIKIKSE